MSDKKMVKRNTQNLKSLDGYLHDEGIRDEVVRMAETAISQIAVLGDYPMEAMPDVAPVFVRQILLQAMAGEYAKATGDSLEDMMPAARATWDTEWGSDPAPRTVRFAIDAALSDLQHWDEE